MTWVRHARTWTSLLGSALVVVPMGCAQDRDATPPATAPPVAASQATLATTALPACALITATEMSSIIAAAVSAEGGEGGGTATCRYKAAEGSSPYVEIAVDRGSGAVAMASFGMLAKREPGISNPLDGLGDEATAIGPALMVRLGDDLLNLTLWGLDDDVTVAKRIIDTMRPRMGTSAQPKTSPDPVSGHAAPGDTAAADAAKAAAIAGGLLDGLLRANERPAAAAASDKGVAARPATGPSFSDEASYPPFTGSPIRVPLVAGLTIVGAEHEPGRGDYEPIVTITNVGSDRVNTVFSSTLPEGNRVRIPRAVARKDLRQARAFLSWYEEGDPLVVAGATSFSLSAVVLADLRAGGQADVVRIGSHGNPLTALVQRFGSGVQSLPRHTGTLRRVEPHAVAFPVLLNDAAVQLPAIHARGTFDDATIDFHVLDDAENPVILRLAHTAVGRIVRIGLPTPTFTPIEETLKARSRVALHGIYFDAGKDTIRPESEPVLRDIAAALTHNPSWRVTIEGHTDDVGGEALNLDLSRRRAESVKHALRDRYHVPAAGMATSGFGPSRPAAPNDTLSGRARNRRVELVRQ